ncbi:pectinesterase family protein [Kaistella sp. 97-N-M2]|uniref:pectinesterase family protein n=1 Tax=Kaistella sp. 97-N-M2 TaxID=2908645 RepID=UPI001F327D36|nr:pectinesterase family protein [Kaistella sp. 97-N-M2]UJF28990.1 pectinesterase family protein [Kaistella sp. 97-N-M2]
MMKTFLVAFSLLISVLNFAQDKSFYTVSKDGSGDFVTIQDAINNTKAFPGERITIFIKNGIYKAKVKLHEWNSTLSLIGESKDSTIITYDDHFKKIGLGRNSTFFTPTLLVEGNDAILKNLTIENSAGDIGQAIALTINANRVAIINCKLLGNQDTLYLTGEGKQYFKNCFIEGTTDFIFGSATAFFENCEILSKKDSYITAASTPKNTEFGFVFQQCRFTAAKDISKVLLGRPWRIYAKTAILNSTLENHILPVAWENWAKKEAEKTSFYAEFNNSGKGSDLKNRVKWSHQLTKKEAKMYTKENVLKDSKHPFWFKNAENIN